MGHALIGFNCNVPGGLQTAYVNDDVRDKISSGINITGHAANLDGLIEAFREFFGDDYWKGMTIPTIGTPPEADGHWKMVFPNTRPFTGRGSYTIDSQTLYYGRGGDPGGWWSNHWGSSSSSREASTPTLLGAGTVSRVEGWYTTGICVFRSSEIDTRNKKLNIDDNTPTLSECSWLELTYNSQTFNYSIITTGDSVSVNPLSSLYNRNKNLGQVHYDTYVGNIDTDPYAGINGESDISGGSIAIPGFPPATATGTGIVGLFAPSESQMRDLADYMWTDFGGQGTSVVDVLQEIVEAIKRSISNPLDYVLGLNIIPSQGLSIGASQVIRFGYVSSGISMPRLTSQYFAVDCGTLHFDPLCGDTFLDYAPYSKFSIFLPYIGARELDANDCVGHTIGVVYHGDTVTGGLTAYVTKDGVVLYQFSGSCALSIPLSSDGWGSTISAAVQIATTIATAGASAGSAGVAKAAAQGAASVAANPSLLSPQVAHSGAVSGTAGCMGVQHPYIIREAVRFHSTEHFNTLTGYPSFYYRELSEVGGYTRVLDVHLSGIPATQDEVAEIETLLKEGVEL